MSNVLTPNGLGTVDWTGATAPPGGTHTGTSTLTMKDGTTFVVSSNRSEVLRKLDVHAVASTAPFWVAFDQPGVGPSIVLDASQIVAIS